MASVRPRPPRWSLKIAAVCVAMGCVYGIANFLSGKYYLPGCSFAELRPQVALPMFIGVLYGPLAGFATGASGDMLGYAFAGKGPLFALHWSFANGLMGLIPGLAGRFGARPVDSILSFVKLLLLLLLASALPFALSTGVEVGLGRVAFHNALFSLFLPIFITDTLWAFMLVPPLMQLFGLLIARVEIRTIQAVYYLLIVTVMATWLSSIFITMRERIAVEELYGLGAVTLVVLITGLAVCAVLSKKITAPMLGLTRVARRVADGDYTHVEELKSISSRQDELGTMAQVFTDMLQAVEKREKDLRNEVTTLKIQIDRGKQCADLEKITGSDYFKMLKAKAGNLRQKAGAAER
ncbi:HAMP domain-containing protein [Desulfatiglans anilini]|uniref:HAMP domain-containing protein n=1 Tax=Desulfatiglans anilini TaxID=90728 RepID=UPI0006850F49|nr:ECF transporter S component [Desulfatiglans anilini]